jgi:hypothetical protein
MRNIGFFGFQTSGGGIIPPPVSIDYGSFFDTTTQIFAANTDTPMKFNSVDLSNGVSIVNDGLGNPTQITVTTDGVYNLQFSAQTHKIGGGGTATMYIFFSKNNIPIPDSNTSFTEANNNRYAVLSWNFFVNLLAGEFMQIIVHTTSNQFRLENLTPAGMPAVPSIILTVNKIA